MLRPMSLAIKLIILSRLAIEVLVGVLMLSAVCFAFVCVCVCWVCVRVLCV